jgi:hypothetical protein
MSNNMIECPICQFRFSATLRVHCPTCGTIRAEFSGLHKPTVEHYGLALPIVVAHGAERARQLPQSPRFFQLVD